MKDFDFSNIRDIYQEGIDTLIDNLGKPVLLTFEDTVTGVDSGFGDVRDDSLLMPAFKGTQASPAPQVQKNTKVILALIKHAPKDYQNYDIRVSNPNEIVRLKTYLTVVPDLKRCKYMMPNYGLEALQEQRFKLVKEPVAIGLKTNRYAISFWEHI